MWLIENPWPPIAICGALACLLWIAWFRNARSLYLYGMIGLGVLAALFYFLESAIVTEPEKVEQLQRELAEAVRRDDPESVVSYISESKTVLRAEIMLGMSRYRVESDLEITDDRARWNDDKTKIISHLRANGRAGMKPGGDFARHVPTRWEFTWDKNSEGEWKIVSVQRLHPVSGEQIGMLDRPE